MEIRGETPSDCDGIRRVQLEAFPSEAEADLVDRLRQDGAVISLVAFRDGAVLGHVMFSRMQAPAGTLGLGPVAVLRAHRRLGIAATLVNEGLALARACGWSAVFVLGDPAYYRRFGFDPVLAEGFATPYASQHLMGLELEPGRSPSAQAHSTMRRLSPTSVEPVAKSGQ
jgi:putative acetyltransferase